MAVVASRSRDGGRSWSPPATVADAVPGDETDSIVASPTVAGHAYLAWANWDHTFTLPMANSLRFSRTTRRRPHLVLRCRRRPARSDHLDFAPRILVVPDRSRHRRAGPGLLVTVFARADLASGIGSLLASRSVDDGRTWLPAMQIGSQPIGLRTREVPWSHRGTAPCR
jgi:hypothetical protein